MSFIANISRRKIFFGVVTVGLAILAFWLWLPKPHISEKNLITNGVYQEPTKIEAVIISGDEIEFKILVSNDNQTRVFNRKYKYTLSTDGKIRVSGSSNDTVFVFGVLNYDWTWDGKNIVRKHFKNGDTMIFTLKSERGTTEQIAINIAWEEILRHYPDGKSFDITYTVVDVRPRPDKGLNIWEVTYDLPDGPTEQMIWITVDVEKGEVLLFDQAAS